VINTLCDNLLLTAFAIERKIVTMEMLDEVSADMRLEWPGQPEYSSNSGLPPSSSQRIPF